jgi:hypothetical protein
MGAPLLDVGSAKLAGDAEGATLEKMLALVGSGGRGASSTTVGFSSEGFVPVKKGLGLAAVFFDVVVAKGFSFTVAVLSEENRLLCLEAVPFPKGLEAADVADESEESPIR